MVLQVLANLWAVHNDRDTSRFKNPGLSNARTLEKLRRHDAASRNNDFVLGRGSVFLSIASKADARSGHFVSILCENDILGRCIGEDMQVSVVSETGVVARRVRPRRLARIYRVDICPYSDIRPRKVRGVCFNADCVQCLMPQCV